MRRRCACLFLAASLLAACDADDGSEERHVSSTGVIMRPYVAIPEGSVPRGSLAALEALAPPGPAFTEPVLARGREQFETFCTPCHGESGRGDGPVVRRGFPKPPSYFEERLLAAPPEHFVTVITEGKGAMWPYAERVLPENRWAIAGYIKALQEAERESAQASAPGGAARP